jgi:outer membrane protein OmpA-like peptidoglycan-associated protein
VRRACAAHRRSAGRALRAATLALAFGLAGCNPAVEAYRNLSGISQDDPDPATAPFAKNLAAGEAAPYPNLASVPPPPTRELSTAEREALTRSLVADRTSVRRSDAELRATHPAPPTPRSGAADAPARTAAARPHSGAPAAQPLETSLQSPAIRGLPSPEVARPAPPQPHLTPAAASATAAPVPRPAALASIAPPPPPPIRPAPPPPAIGRSAPAQALQAPAPVHPLAEIRFAAGASAIGPAGRAALVRLVPGWRQHPSRLRVVAYAPIAGGADEQLSSFHTALERAQAVVAVLAKAGIPKNRMRVEAAPAAPGAAGDRALVLPAP